MLSLHEIKSVLKQCSLPACHASPANATQNTQLHVAWADFDLQMPRIKLGIQLEEARGFSCVCVAGGFINAMVDLDASCLDSLGSVELVNATVIQLDKVRINSAWKPPKASLETDLQEAMLGDETCFQTYKHWTPHVFAGTLLQQTLEFIRLIAPQTPHLTCSPPSIQQPNSKSLSLPFVQPLLFTMSPTADSNYLILVSAHCDTNLRDTLLYDPHLLLETERRRFLVLQLVEMTKQLHQLGIAGLALVPQAIGFDKLQHYTGYAKLSDWWLRLLPQYLWPSLLGLPKPKFAPLPDLLEATQQWTLGQLSNLSYLMTLGIHAGRCIDTDPALQPLLPWPCDFTGSSFAEPGNPRDMTKTKYRLTKGDEQLDLQYHEQSQLRSTLLAGAVLDQGQEAWVPHHITHLLSDTTTLVYHARQLPTPVLEHFVRSPFSPTEYPSTLARLYKWSPDELTPFFFATMPNSDIFQSTHPAMPDLTVFSQASGSMGVQAQLARLLESDHVTAGLPDWIDLIYGPKLVGQAALDAKNVAFPLSAAGATENPTLEGRDDGRLALEKVIAEEVQPARPLLETGQGPWIVAQRGDKHGVKQLFTNSHPRKSKSPAVAKKMDLFVSPVVSSKSLASPPVLRRGVKSTKSVLFSQAASDDIKRLGFLLLLIYAVPNSIPKHSATSRVSVMTCIDKFARLDSVGAQDVEMCWRYASSVKPLLSQLLKSDPPTASSLLEQLPKSIGIVNSSLYKYVWEFKSLDDDGKINLTAQCHSQLSGLSEDLYLLVLPCVLSLFNATDPNVRASALTKLFDSVAQRLGKEGSRLFLLRPIVTAAEVSSDVLKRRLTQPAFIKSCLHRFSLEVFCDRLLPLYYSSLLDDDGLAASALIGIATLLGPVVTVKYLLSPLIQVVLKDSLDSLEQVIAVMGFRFGETFVLHQLVPRVKTVLERPSTPLHLTNALFLYEKLVALFPASTMQQEEAEVIGLIKRIALELIATNGTEHVVALATCMRIFVRVAQTLPNGSWRGAVLDVLHTYLDSDEFVSGIYSMDIVMYIITSFEPLIADFRDEFPGIADLESSPLESSPTQDPPTLSVHRPKKRSLSKRVVRPILNTVRKISSSIAPPGPSGASSVQDKDADEFSLTYSMGISPSKPSLKLSNPLFAKSKLSVKEDKQAWTKLLSTLDTSRDTNFRDLRLRHFMGHTGKVTRLAVDEADSLLASASKDHTVKLWSLSKVYQDVEGGLDWSEATVTYAGHQHSVFDVFIMDKMMASCDGDVHVWNPETGKMVTLFDARSSLVACRWVDNSFVGASNDQIITFRDKSPVSVWKASAPPSYPNATIRQLAVDPNDRLIVVGWSSGHCSLLDRRTGRSLATWKSHEGDINQLSFHTSNYVVASSTSQQGVHVWNLNDLNEIRTFNAHVDVNAFAIQDADMVVLGASASTVKFVSLTNELRSHSAKIRTRSPLTAVSVLPVNSLFAFGCQEGEVMLYA